MYIALKVCGAAEHRQETLNHLLHELGICISHAKVQDFSKDMANSIVNMFEAECVPCGPILRKGLLMVGSAERTVLSWICVGPISCD